MPISHPRLRPVQAVQGGSEGRVELELRDGDASARMRLNPAGLFMASLMDGSRSLERIAEEVGRQIGCKVGVERVEALSRALAEAGLLEDEEGRSRGRTSGEARKRPSPRRAAHAGAVYPGDLGRCRDFFARMLSEYSVGDRASARGLVSPHIDYARGREAYARLWSGVDLTGVERVVVFGTSHAAARSPYVFTRRDFETPLGLAHTDRTWVDRVADDLGERVFDEEYLHCAEHSIELQIPFIQQLGPVAIVPVLCGSVHRSVLSGFRPESDSDVGAHERAMRAALEGCAGRTLLVAAADLAHVGQQFGDEGPLEDDALREVQARDEALLDIVEAGDPEAFYDHVAEDRDARRICGFAPIWTVLRLLRGARGQVAHYGQAVDRGIHSAVTFASVVLD